jgi:tetratricopeptide (TPR) repeat protein
VLRGPPQSPRLLTRANAHVALARLLKTQMRHDEALQELRNILLELRMDADWTGFTPVYESLAEIYADCGQLEEALASAHEAVRLQPANARVQSLLASMQQRSALERARGSRPAQLALAAPAI